ncbi:MAG: RNA polymerase factor sigma-54 [Gemmatimonadetes bacterium]|nr:RNA polymerase factor sigma-54 [Gemmatimonadota bacterium]
MSGFSTKLFQSQQLRQEMKINPRLYHAMELLYLPLLDLQQHLKTEMEENPFLEMSEADVEDDVELGEDDKDDPPEDEIDWEGILLDGFEVGGRREQYEAVEVYQRAPVETTDLRDHLQDQLRLLDLTEREVRLGEEIIGNVNDAGTLTCELTEVVIGVNAWLEDVRSVAQKEVDALENSGKDQREDRREAQAELDLLFQPYQMHEAEEMLQSVQGFDPPGVAARDLRESILIQLRQLGRTDSLTYEIAERFFDELVSHRWADVAREMSVKPVEVQTVADEIAKLDPKPGMKYSPDPERYIVPDLIVEKIDGEYMVFVNDTSIPRLRIARSYQSLAQNKALFKGENKEFVSRKLNSANWIIQAIEQRRQTMLKVMAFIVDRQRSFFENGVQHLRPLTLREVADHIEMHESTVSRVTNEKFVQTPRGVFPLKYFFSSGLATTSGEDISARSVRDKIQKLVDEENELKPLTDQKIVELLKTNGVKIARRTVAKYRDQLGVLPARMRKRV